MNEITLSNYLVVITAEINSYKRVAGQAIFEIGKRLRHVRDNDLAHGQYGKWLDSVGIHERQAQRLMRIADELGENATTWSELPFKKARNLISCDAGYALAKSLNVGDLVMSRYTNRLESLEKFLLIYTKRRMGMEEKTEKVTREEFAEFLLNMRTSAGLGIRDMAREIGTAHSNIRAWERQATFPRDANEVIRKVREVVKRKMQAKRDLESVKNSLQS